MLQVHEKINRKETNKWYNFCNFNEHVGKFSHLGH